jgi:hypothetical protein
MFYWPRVVDSAPVSVQHGQPNPIIEATRGREVRYRNPTGDRRMTASNDIGRWVVEQHGAARIVRRLRSKLFQLLTALAIACGVMLQPQCAGAQASYDPRVEPTLPIAGEAVWFFAMLPQMSCFNELATLSVNRVGTDVNVRYTVAPERNVCFTVMPPLFLYTYIGTFAAGRYVVQATGDFQGLPNPPIVVSFSVAAIADGGPVPAIEFYREPADHYFVTADADEIVALDSGRLSGWARTGYSFRVLPASAAPPAGASNVCRFYGRPEAGLDSHFYSAFANECQAVQTGFSEAWLLESLNVFSVNLPSVPAGSCPAGSNPVYRLFNNRRDANHRYTQSLAVRAQMVRAGWIPEGYGQDGVAMCAE